MRVDVLLPTHARPHTIPFAIESVRRQGHPDWTLHVVGDGADEATEAAVRAIGDDRVVYHRLPKAPGYGYANRNRVLAGCDAPYVAYMSDDDLWFPDHLEYALESLERDQLGMVGTGTLVVRPPGEADPHFFGYAWPVPELRHWFVGAPNLVHRRRVIDELGGWQEDLPRFGDRELYNRVRRSAIPTRLLPRPTLLRFFAGQWDEEYARHQEPPQAAWLARLADPEAVRSGLAAPARLADRGRQVLDFCRFAVKRGPGFVRFLSGRRARS